MKYQTIQINKLSPDPNQPRKHMDEETLKEMAVSIKNEGLINPIEVDEKFVIVTGERRWRAAQIAGLKEVSVKVLDKIAPKDRFIRQIQENIHQNTMAPLDTAMALDKIRGWVASSAVELARDKFHQGKHFQKGVTELHKLLGIPESTISTYLDLLGVSPELKKALQTPGFSMSKIATIKEAPKKYQKGLGHVVATQMDVPRDTIRHIATALRRADSYDEDDDAKKLLNEDFEGLSVVGAITKINKIVPDEMSRVQGPADALRIISEKTTELIMLLEDHLLTSFDDFHRSFLIKDLSAMGFCIQAYLQGKDIKNTKISETKLIEQKK